MIAWIVMSLFAGWALNWRTTAQAGDGVRRKVGWVVLGLLVLWAGTWVYAILGFSCPVDVPLSEC